MIGFSACEISTLLEHSIRLFNYRFLAFVNIHSPPRDAFQKMKPTETKKWRVQVEGEKRAGFAWIVLLYREGKIIIAVD